MQHHNGKHIVYYPQTDLAITKGHNLILLLHCFLTEKAVYSKQFIENFHKVADFRSNDLPSSFDNENEAFLRQLMDSFSSELKQPFQQKYETLVKKIWMLYCNFFLY